MGQGNIVVANGTPENIEVLGSAGIVYERNSVDDLARWLQEIADFPEKYETLKTAALARARNCYSWESVVTEYEGLFTRLTNRGLAAQATRSKT